MSLFLALGISTVAVLANQLEQEKCEYWIQNFRARLLSFDLYMTKVEVTFCTF